jgi:hypothetical protein
VAALHFDEATGGATLEEAGAAARKITVAIGPGF